MKDERPLGKGAVVGVGGGEILGVGFRLAGGLGSNFVTTFLFLFVE